MVNQDTNFIDKDTSPFGPSGVHHRKVPLYSQEGKSEEKVPVQAELVRKIIKAIVPCDVTRDPPIPTEYVDKYDIVTDHLCPMSACATTEDYIAALVRLQAACPP